MKSSTSTLGTTRAEHQTPSPTLPNFSSHNVNKIKYNKINTKKNNKQRKSLQTQLKSFLFFPLFREKKRKKLVSLSLSCMSITFDLCRWGHCLLDNCVSRFTFIFRYFSLSESAGYSPATQRANSRILLRIQTLKTIAIDLHNPAQKVSHVGQSRDRQM